MSYRLKTIPPFDNELKKLSKKYKSLSEDYSAFLDEIEENPFIGGNALGKDCYKIRLAIKSKGRGKSGGARVIACIKIIQSTVYLLSIYDKSDMDTISDEELKARLKEIK